MPLRLLFPQLAQLAATAAMCGIIWTVQIAIYPLFAEIDPGSFANYHTGYMERITWVIAPVMLLEAVTCGWLLYTQRYDRRVWVASALLVIAWISTLLIQIPLHEGLLQSEVNTLVHSNWIRTIIWSARLSLLSLIFLRPSTI